MTLKEAMRIAETRYWEENIRLTRGDYHMLTALSGVHLATLYRRLHYCSLNLASARPKAPVQTPEQEQEQLLARALTTQTGGIRIRFLLDFFGVAYVLGANGKDLWSLNDPHVLYYDARRAYLARVRQLHPDVGASGNTALMAKTNEAWRYLESAFRAHGVTC